MDFSHPVRVAASKYPDRRAIVYRDESLTFAELDHAVNRVAAGLLAAGVADAPIAGAVFNDPFGLCLFMAVARSGAVCVPINSRLHPSEKAFIIDNARAETIVIDAACISEVDFLLEHCQTLKHVFTVNHEDPSPWPRLEDLMKESAEGDVLLPIAEDQTATIMYTSGTTGFPKGVTRTHRANLATVVNSSLALGRLPSDVELFALPIFGVGFLNHPIPALLAGATVVLDRTFDPRRTWEIIETHSVTTTFLAPTMINSMLALGDHQRYDVSSLRFIGVAYEFPRKLREAALERFGNIFINMYGLTEAQLCCTRLGEFADDPTSVGKPMGLARIKIVDDDGKAVPAGTVGEIAFDAPSVMSGYHGLPEETAKTIRDGWVHSGDLGRIDGHGNLHFAGRSKEIIKTGGYSVDPVEVENVILELEGIREAAVVGAPDEHWGETVTAVVVRTDQETPSEADLIAHSKAHLTDYKVPKRVLFLSELPKNATGKTDRGSIRKLLQSNE